MALDPDNWKQQTENSREQYSPLVFRNTAMAQSSLYDELFGAEHIGGPGAYQHPDTGVSEPYRNSLD